MANCRICTCWWLAILDDLKMDRMIEMIQRYRRERVYERRQSWLWRWLIEMTLWLGAVKVYYRSRTMKKHGWMETASKRKRRVKSRPILSQGLKPSESSWNVMKFLMMVFMEMMTIEVGACDWSSETVKNDFKMNWNELNFLTATSEKRFEGGNELRV